MAFSAVTERGSISFKSAGTTIGVSPSAALTVGKIVFATFHTDDLGAADGASTNHDTMVDTDGHTWNKVVERTNGTGTPAQGVTGSLWWTKVTSEIGTGDTVTATIDGSVVFRGIGLFEVTVGAGNTIQLAGSAFLQDELANPGAVTISGLASKEYLWLGIIWSEQAQLTWTEDADYTNVYAAEGIGGGGGGASTNITAQIGYRIATLTGDTFDTAGSTATEHAIALLAFEEVPAAGQSLTGTLFTNAPVFNTGLISHQGNLVGVLFTKAPTFHVGIVTQEQVQLTAFPIRQQISHLVTPGTSISGVLRASPIEDNMVFALVSAETTLVNLTGPSGYTKAAEEEGDAVSIQLWYKRAGAAESATVTVTSSVSVALKIHVFESPAGMFIVDDPLDVVDTNDSGLSSVTTLSAGTTATVSQTNTFAIAAVIARSANLDFGLVNWSDGFTALSDYETLGLMTAYKVMTAAEAATTTATWSQLVASHRAAGLIATFAMTVTLTPPAPAPRRVSFGSRRDELNTTGTVDTVATFPMVADHLYLAFVVSSKQLINDGDSVIENSHGGQPWTLEQSHSIGAARRVHVFRSVSATDLAAASISITTPEADIAVLWTVLDVTGFDPSGVNGAGAIRQVAAGDENSGDVFVEVSFVSAPLATSGVVGLCLHGASERQLVDVSPLHLLFSESKVSDSSEQVTVDWYHGSDDTFRWDWATSIHAIAIIAEIAVPLIGVSQTPNATTSNVGWDTAPSAGQSIHTYIATDDTDYITVTVP